VSLWNLRRFCAPADPDHRTRHLVVSSVFARRTSSVIHKKGDNVTNSKIVLIDRHPGRSAQSIGMAQVLGTDPALIHEPSVGVVGTKGDSHCYLGVMSKVGAIHACLKGRIGTGPGQLALRLVQPEYTIATSDGTRNGTREMRYSLIGREVTHDALCEHLEANGLASTIAVVACDKPPVGTLAALLEHNQPAIIMSDGPIHPGHDPETGAALDIVSAYHVAGHADTGHCRK
jgi:dihydroxy-acid dehydratase